MSTGSDREKPYWNVGSLSVIKFTLLFALLKIKYIFDGRF